MTPGPFYMDGLNIVGADGCVVATMNKPGGDLSSTAYGDGRLFVAAPDLLRVVRRLEEYHAVGSDVVSLSSLMPDSDETLGQAVEAAFCKAVRAAQ